MKIANLALLVAAGSLVACSASSSPTDDKAQVEEVRSSLARDTAPVLAPNELDQLATDQADFAVDLYKSVAQQAESASKDIFISPHSVSTALAMTYAGAAG